MVHRTAPVLDQLAQQTGETVHLGRLEGTDVVYLPNITVELLRGRTTDQRRAFAEAVADSAVALLGARRQDVRMVFQEITPDVVANGGVLASEDTSRAAVVAALDGSD